MSNYRKVTNQLAALMDNGVLDPRTVANAALAYLSEDDVAEMARINELIIDDEDDVTFADLFGDYEDEDED